MNISNFCLILALLVFTAPAKADKIEDLRAMSKKCEEEAHTTEEELKNFFKNGQKPADAKDSIKCHIKCMMEKQGHLKNGAFDESAFLKSIEDVPNLKPHLDAIKKIASECKGEKGTNDCDTAYKILTCFSEKKRLLGATLG